MYVLIQLNLACRSFRQWGLFMMVKPEDMKRDQTTGAIQKVGAVILKNKKVLVVKKHCKESGQYLMVGGKMEEGETQIETLKREILEELGVNVTEYRYMGTYEGIAAFEQIPIIVHAYRVDIDAEPTPQSEIEECIWVDRQYGKHGIKLGTIISSKIMPILVQENLI